jgi:hypothetical protein
MENGDVAFRACGPTAAAMALVSLGVSLPTAKVASACWDARHAIYGNWPFLAAGASALLRQGADRLPYRAGQRKAFRAYVAWHPDWKGVEEEIRQGHPCLVSIAFGPGELPGAGTGASAGHIILVRGFTRTGDVVCSDPASRKPEVVFDRHKLLKARHGAPVIVIAPYAEADPTP